MFNIGDLVRIKDNANDIRVGNVYWCESMDEYLGGTYKIFYKKREKEYLLEGCNATHTVNNDPYPNYWRFHESWLEPVINVNIDTNNVLELFNV